MILDTKHRFDALLREDVAMDTLAAKVARYPFVAARLDAEGRIIATCDCDHGRREPDAVACARTHGWDGFAELLVTDDAPIRPLDVWRFRETSATTHLERLGVVTGVDVVLWRDPGSNETLR